MGMSPLEGLIMGTRCGDIDPVVIEFICTLSAWGATFSKRFLLRSGVISTHAPRVGSDYHQLHRCAGTGDFNPRSPRGERRRKRRSKRPSSYYFNPRSPRGERLTRPAVLVSLAGISTHAPRVGSDLGCWAKVSAWAYFNPRSPRGERPGRYTNGADTVYFNPRSPRGERQGSTIQILDLIQFQPTLPAGERLATLAALSTY